MRRYHEIPLVGLDGSNLLAFLAALGTLRTLSLASGDSARMSWKRQQGAWRPVVHHAAVASSEEVVAELVRRLNAEGEPNPALTAAKNLTTSAMEFNEQARRAAAAALPDSRAWADLLAAFACEACADEKGTMQDTAFRAIRVTRPKEKKEHEKPGFLDLMALLHRCTVREDIESALGRRWEYADPPPSLRWDPNDFRPHALRALDPEKDKIRTVRGANRLAIEALPLFAVVPGGRRLFTTAFQESEVTWPVWEPVLELWTVRSLLALKELHAPVPDRGALAARGVRQAYRARRFTEGQYRNFSPARELL